MGLECKSALPVYSAPTREIRNPNLSCPCMKSYYKVIYSDRADFSLSVFSLCVSLCTLYVPNPFQNTSKLRTECSESITHLLRIKSQAAVHSYCDAMWQVPPLLSVAPRSVCFPIAWDSSWSSRSISTLRPHQILSRLLPTWIPQLLGTGVGRGL